MSKESFRDLKNELELKNAEIDELNMELEQKKEEINKLKLYSTKLKYENKNLEDKLDTKIDYDKARLKELDDLQEKIVEKESFTVLAVAKKFNYQDCKKEIPVFWKEHYEKGNDWYERRCRFVCLCACIS
mgnify:CR=1 FL=1